MDSQTTDVSEQTFQEINITALWHKNLYNSLEKLQDFERICREGATSIMEWLQIPRERLAEIKFQYLKMMITEMGILLANAKAKLDKKFFINSILKLGNMKNLVDLNSHEIFISSLDQRNNITINYLSEEYFDILIQLGKMREMIINELSEVLYGKPEKKMEGMDKNQPLK